MSESSSGPGPRGKVERLLEEYDLQGVGEYLVDRWTAEDAAERSSLRALAHEFNVRLLEVRLTAVDEEPIEGTVQQYYEALTESDVSGGVRTQVRRRLEQVGVDVDELENEFVSRQAIHTYLTKTRGVSQPASTQAVDAESIRETIDRLRERLRQVSASRLERLRAAGEITLGEFRVIVDVQVYCSDCGVQREVSELLTAGGCECPDRTHAR